MKEYTLKEIQVGTTEFFRRTITVEMENAFREITGDVNPLHQDDRYASEIWGGQV